MKKFLAILSIALITACVPETETKEDGKPTTSDASCKIKALKDHDLGKVYYAPSHRLYKHVSNFDKKYCTESQARSAGYSSAPSRFPNSTAEYIECLDGEGTSGNCHNYVSGIYQSLKIYEKVCGPATVSKPELADTVRNYAKKSDDRMDADRYSSISSAIVAKYSCGGKKKK